MTSGMEQGARELLCSILFSRAGVRMYTLQFISRTLHELRAISRLYMSICKFLFSMQLKCI